MKTSLKKYLKAFSNLRRGGTKYGVAPHKPVLLLSIIDLFSKGVILENKINVAADLVGTFKENWQLLVPTQHQPDFTLPFFHLQNDNVDGVGFWFLKSAPGITIEKPISNINVLASKCEFAFLAPDLYQLLTQVQERAVLHQHLLDTYFFDFQDGYRNAKSRQLGYLTNLELYILNEPSAKLVHIDKHIEEDVFVRAGIFKKEIPIVYGRQCSFTGMKLESTFEHNFVDACHIVPFGVSHDDKITNGISLCPNLHRAFDRGMVSIDDDYRIIVSNHLREDIYHPYSLRSLNGSQIILPEKELYYPSLENIAWHRNNIFKP